MFIPVCCYWPFSSVWERNKHIFVPGSFLRSGSALMLLQSLVYISINSYWFIPPTAACGTNYLLIYLGYFASHTAPYWMNCGNFVLSFYTKWFLHLNYVLTPVLLKLILWKKCLLLNQKCSFWWKAHVYIWIDLTDSKQHHAVQCWQKANRFT